MTTVRMGPSHWSTFANESLDSIRFLNEELIYKLATVWEKDHTERVNSANSIPPRFNGFVLELKLSISTYTTCAETMLIPVMPKSNDHVVVCSI